MAIPVLQPPMPTFLQANPELQAMQVNQNLQQQATQNQYLAPMLQAKLRQMGLAAQQMPIKTQLMKEQAQFYPQLTQSQINEAAARAALTQQQAKQLPLQTLIQAQNQSRLQQRFGPNYSFARLVQSLPSAIKAQFIAQNPNAWNNILTAAGNTALNSSMPQNDPYQAQISAMIKKLYPQEGAQPDGALPQQQTVGQRVYNAIQNQPNVAQTAQSLVGFGYKPDAGEKMALIGLNEANQEAAGGKSGLAVKRAVAASQMESWLANQRLSNIKRMNNALQYAGIKGQTKSARDAWLNKNPDALSDYIWFRDQFTPSLSNQYKFIEGMTSTDSQRKEMKSLINDVSKFSSDPQRARMSFNKMVDTLHSLAEADFQAAEPVNKGVYHVQYNLPQYTGDYLDGTKPLVYPTRNEVQQVLKGAAGKVQVGAPQGAQNVPQNVPRGTTVGASRIRVKSPDGKIGTIPTSQLNDALNQGYTRIQ